MHDVTLQVRVRHEIPSRFAGGGPRRFAKVRAYATVAVAPIPSAIPVMVPDGHRPMHALLFEGRLYVQADCGPNGRPSNEPEIARQRLVADKPHRRLDVRPLAAELPYNLMRERTPSQSPIEDGTESAAIALARFAATGLRHQQGHILVRQPEPLLDAGHRHCRFRIWDPGFRTVEMPRLPGSAFRVEAYAAWLRDRGLSRQATEALDHGLTWRDSARSLVDTHAEIEDAVQELPGALCSRAGLLLARRDRRDRVEVAEAVLAKLGPWLCRCAIGAVQEADWLDVLVACRDAARTFAALGIAQTYRDWYALVGDYLDGYAIPACPSPSISEDDAESLLSLAPP